MHRTIPLIYKIWRGPWCPGNTASFEEMLQRWKPLQNAVTVTSLYITFCA